MLLFKAGDCPCHKCTTQFVKDNPLDEENLFFGFLDPRLQRMFLCVTCGNKRCPHATDHELECIGSNELGQKGSRYE